MQLEHCDTQPRKQEPFATHLGKAFTSLHTWGSHFTALLPTHPAHWPQLAPRCWRWLRNVHGTLCKPSPVPQILGRWIKAVPNSLKSGKSNWKNSGLNQFLDFGVPVVPAFWRTRYNKWQDQIHHFYEKIMETHRVLEIIVPFDHRPHPGWGPKRIGFKAMPATWATGHGLARNFRHASHARVYCIYTRLSYVYIYNILYIHILYTYII